MSNVLIDDMREVSAVPHVDIALPTRGRFYVQGEVIDDNYSPDEIPVGPISVLDESSFRDPLMMISGKAVTKMINRVCPAITDPGKLCELDIQAILIACRIASYGPIMTISTDCSCGETNQLQIDLNEHILRFDPYSEEEWEKFIVRIEETGQVVHLRPMLYDDIINMTMGMISSSNKIAAFDDVGDDEALSKEFIEMYASVWNETINNNIHALVDSILTVYTSKGQPVTDRETILEWIGTLSPSNTKLITDSITDINAEIRKRSELEYQCQKCGKVSNIFLELDPQKLFTPAEETEPEKVSSAKSKTTGKGTKTRSRISRK